MVSVAILGHGVVGSGVAEILLNKKDLIAKNVGQELKLKRILDLRDFDVPYAELFTKDLEEIAEDPEVRICAECMGGVHPAFEFSKRMLEAGKTVVTSNKELVAYKGAELLKIAKEHQVNYYFEAAVGGGIPLIHPLHQCLGANEILEIAGILNGTTNYILTKMLFEGLPFDVALKKAQEHGYAEKNPAADIEGPDPCRKICILASMVLGKQVLPEHVHTEGITEIKLEDAQFANAADRSLKLIGRMKRLQGDKILCMVSPVLVNNGSQLATIQNVFNGVVINGDCTGEVAFYGKGAGKMATASAVVGDMMDDAKYPECCNSLNWVDDGVNYVEDYLNTSCAFYIRVRGEHAAEKLTSVFGTVEVLHREDQPEDEAAVITEELSERFVKEELEKLAHDGLEILGRIRVLNY